MAGIYIHIPFCKTKCIYCDFFSGTNESEKERFIDRLCREINERKSFLNNQAIKTLYFGGGTPSQLSETDFTRIFNVLNTIYDLSVCDEITIEVNPDDITPEYAQMLRTYPFQRVSMGIQSFND